MCFISLFRSYYIKDIDFDYETSYLLPCRFSSLKTFSVAWVWKNKNISKKTKNRIFSSNLKFLLHYGCETWKVNNQITKKLQTLINRCLRNIIDI